MEKAIWFYCPNCNQGKVETTRVNGYRVCVMCGHSVWAFVDDDDMSKSPYAHRTQDPEPYSLEVTDV